MKCGTHCSYSLTSFVTRGSKTEKDILCNQNSLGKIVFEWYYEGCSYLDDTVSGEAGFVEAQGG
jgi:hypothetical protein